jgi:hypothetical protein
MTAPRCVRLFAICLLLAPAACTDRGADPDGDSPATGTLYSTAATCGTCHPQHLAEWETSMHAFAGSDPVMLALAEVAAQETGDTIGEKCLACHAPAQVRFERWVAEGGDPAQAPDYTDEGISCDVCHSVTIVPPVANIDFLDDVDPRGPKLGGIRDPVPTDAHESLFDSSYQTSANCAPCHQVNLDDGTGVENTYQEWSDSFHSGFGTECQECHMPAYTGRAAEGGPIRQDVHRHKFVGVDYAYGSFRGIDLDAQKADIRALLQNSVTTTASGVPASVAAGGTFTLSVSVANDVKTGHSIPSGTSFSREMWIEVVVTDGTGATIQRSGWLEANGDLVTTALDPDLESFGSIMRDAVGARTFFTWQAATIDESQLLAVGQTRVADYTVPVPVGTTGPLHVSARLLFRPMAPGILRLAGLDHLLPIEVFEMWSGVWQVSVTP